MHSFLNYHEDCQITGKNTLKPRSYYIPFGSYLDAVEKPREKSDRFIKMTGEWAFKLYNDVSDVSADVFSDGIYDGGSVKLPCNIETAGNLVHEYHDAYPFPCDIPYVAQDNPAAVFYREFYLEEQLDGLKKYFVIEGGSPFYLYINGSLAGYSQGRCKLSEFDISELAVTGKNSVCIMAVKYADSAYLECQDLISLWGMSSDMYILARPKGHIEDYTVATELTEHMRGAYINISVKSVVLEGIDITLIGPDGAAIETQTTDDTGCVSFYVESPYIWSAETPDLYTAVISAAGEYITAKIGIRSVSAEEDSLKINNRIVRLKGVVYNPLSSVNGYALTKEEMHKSIIRMKKNNINAIRFTQPPAPLMLELCDSLGMYVIDDTGIDCSFMPDGADPSQLPVLNSAYTDRAEYMYERDKNNACVVIWSLGSGAGKGANVGACCDLIKQKGDTRPVMYCGGVDFDISAVGEWDGMDKPDSGKPVIVYSFTSKSEIIWDKIYRENRFAGAFFDEWSEQAVKTRGSEEYFSREKINVENRHSALISLFGTDMPCLDDLKNVLTPVRVTPIDINAGRFEISNLYDFIYLSRLECFYEITRDGKTLESRSIGTLPIPPQKSQEVEIGYFIPDNGSCTIRFIFRQAGESLWASDGHKVASYQFMLPCGDISVSAPLDNKPLTVSESAKNLTVMGDTVKYIFNKRTGLFDSLAIKDVNLLCAPMSIDSGLSDKIGRRVVTRLYECDYKTTNYGIIIKSALAICANGLMPFADIEAEYKLNSAGDIDMSFHVSLTETAEAFSCFSLILPMNEGFKNIEYSGLGPGISTADMKRGSYYGKFGTDIFKMRHESDIYGKPATRYDTEWAGVFDKNRCGLLMKGNFILCAGVSGGISNIGSGYMTKSISGVIEEREFDFSLLLRPVTQDGRSLRKISLTQYNIYGGYQMRFSENENNNQREV